MSDERDKSAPREVDNTLKRKREGDIVTGLTTTNKDNEVLKSPPAKIQAKGSDTSPPTTNRRPSFELSVKDGPSTSAGPSQEAHNKRTDAQGDEEKGGVEKMQ